MHIWASMLAGVPALGQKQIARFNRVSLSHGITLAERVRLLRRALCHEATVRVVYAGLDAATQAALQHLRTVRGGVSPDELQRRYGSVRSWRQIAADLRPQSIAERLVLHGWLLLRPPTSFHPSRWLLPPEVRRWLPRPLALISLGTAPAAAPPLAAHVAATVLLLCSERPQPVRADGSLRRVSSHALLARLAPLPSDQTLPCVEFVVPLLCDLGLLLAANGHAAPTPAGRRFLALSAREQCEHLRAAWIAAPRPDRWFQAVAPATRGIDWPLLRRRLVGWSDALPLNQVFETRTLYSALSAAFGPIADAQTHGFRVVDRVPWQPRRAAAVWQAALAGPLRWLGYVACEQADRVFRPSVAPEATPATPPWTLGDDGAVRVPHTDPDTLYLLPFANWSSVDAETTIYCVTPATLARARNAGHDTAQLRALLHQRVGACAASWQPALYQPSSMRIADGAIVLADTPAALTRAMRKRSARRALGERVAPGVAIVSQHGRAALVRALERQGIAVETTAPPAPTASLLGLGLHAGECAVLLDACASYRRNAPQSDTPLLDQLEQRLRASVPQHKEPPHDLFLTLAPTGATDDPPLAMLRNAVAAGYPICIRYTNEAEEPTERVVRPLELQRRGDTWYLHAWCALRNAERVFRLDRISAAQRVST